MSPATTYARQAEAALIQAAEATERLTDTSRLDMILMELRHVLLQLEGNDTE